MAPRGYRRPQQQEMAQPSGTSRNTAPSSRARGSRSRGRGRAGLRRTTQEQAIDPIAGNQTSLFGRAVLPVHTDVLDIDDTKLMAMEEIMIQALESSQTWGLYVDPFTDEQVDVWNFTWGTNFRTNTLKAAMDKFQEFKSSLASPEPWSVLDEDSDPITKLICVYRNTMAIGRNADVFNTMLEEATQLCEGYGVDSNVRLDRDPLKVDNDAMLADYIVAMKLLIKYDLHKPEWVNLAGHQMFEIGLREENGIWSGPTNAASLPPAPPQPSTINWDEWNAVPSVDYGFGNSFPPQQNDASYAALENILGESDMNDNPAARPIKRNREDDHDTEAEFGEESRPRKRLTRVSDQPRAILAERASAALQQFGVVPAGSRPRMPAEHITSRSNHPRAGEAGAGFASQLSTESQLEVDSADGDWEEYQEDDFELQSSLPPREISPFFDGEEDVELQSSLPPREMSPFFAGEEEVELQSTPPPREISPFFLGEEDAEL